MRKPKKSTDPLTLSSSVMEREVVRGILDACVPEQWHSRALSPARHLRAAMGLGGREVASLAARIATVSPEALADYHQHRRLWFAYVVGEFVEAYANAWLYPGEGGEIVAKIRRLLLEFEHTPFQESDLPSVSEREQRRLRYPSPEH